MKRFAHCLAALLLAVAASALAGAPRELRWQDLVPPLPADHPMAKLTRAQALQLKDIADVRERKARGEKVSAVDLADEQGAVRKLQQAGVDVEGLLARRQELAEQERARYQNANPALDGVSVRMPGYLLPLEFSGKAVTEFLLVPWVGACIHTPPPPPNQIVHVKTDKPVENATLYAPIWVTGKMSTKASKQSLYLVDGASNIDIGYSMSAAVVEPYKE
jgi:hypothetical protein